MTQYGTEQILVTSIIGSFFGGEKEFHSCSNFRGAQNFSCVVLNEMHGMYIGLVL